jgi:phosphinothricin acetyltransferase
MDIRPAEPDDAAAIAAIYNHYVANTCITFETDAVSVIDMANASPKPARRTCRGCSRKPTARCWATHTPRSGKAAAPIAFRRIHRVSRRRENGQGIGKPLYAALIDALRARAMHAVIGGIALPNDASIALHERMGFEKVAHFRQVGSSRTAGSTWVMATAAGVTHARALAPCGQGAFAEMVL